MSFGHVRKLCNMSVRHAKNEQVIDFYAKKARRHPVITIKHKKCLVTRTHLNSRGLGEALISLQLGQRVRPSAPLIGEYGVYNSHGTRLHGLARR